MNDVNVREKHWSKGEERQPEPWESLLRDVTVEADSHEVAFDPAVLGLIHHQLDFRDYMDVRTDDLPESEQARQLALVRNIADQKLTGLTRQCMLVLLATGRSHRQIAKMLGVSHDKVQRALQKGIRQIQECLASPKTGEFPVEKSTRPVARASVFPLDTNEERQQFQTFINNNIITHLSYRGDAFLREALVVYLTGKPARNVL